MEYTISEDRLLKLIGKMVHHVEPEFNSEQSVVKEFKFDGDNYLIYHKQSDLLDKPYVFARYYSDTKELELNPDIFFSLEDYFGEDKMTMVIDWFNQEFNQDAETVNY
jgi:hypothetical protein